MENNASNYILKAQHVTIRYDGRSDAVADVSFEIQSGDFLLVVGENGSGKSTLIKGILGLLKLSGGSISFGGRDTARKIGYLSQNSDSDKDFPATVNEVVLSGFVGKKGLFSFYSRRDRRKADEVLEYLGIKRLKDKSFGALSGGERQKVLLARALVSATFCEPCAERGCTCHDETFCHTNGLLLLDEPSNGLDPVANKALYATLSRLNREKGMTVVMVSHLVESAIEYADKVLHMGKGVRFFGSRDEYLSTELGKHFSKGEGRRYGNE